MKSLFRAILLAGAACLLTLGTSADAFAGTVDSQCSRENLKTIAEIPAALVFGLIVQD